MLLRVNRVAAGVLALLAGAAPTLGFLATMLLAYAGAASPAWPKPTQTRLSTSQR